MKPKFVIQWHITHKCNLRCKHCYQEDYSKDLEEEVLVGIFEQCKAFLDENHFFGHFNFTGGEPLLSPALWRLLDLCEANGNTFGILTNATLLNEETVDRLASYNRIRFVQASVDGTKERHDEIRGEGSFERTMHGLELLRKKGIQTMVSFTCSKENQTELKDVIRLCEKNKIDRFWTDRLVPIGNNELTCMSTEEYAAFLKVLGRESRRAAFLPWINTTIHTNRAMQFICNKKECGYMCSAGKGLLAILADGTILPCRRLPFVLGNATESPIVEIMSNNPVLKEIFSTEDPQECQQCNYRKKCHSGAKCLTYAVKGKLSEKDINCWKNRE